MKVGRLRKGSTLLYLYFTLLIIGCNPILENSENSISIQIHEKGFYTVNKRRISKKYLKEYLIQEVKKIEELGYSREEIVTVIKADSGTKMKHVVDLQVILKDLKMKKIIYSD
ncbi:hypothetical protein QQ008_27855 [Fulvivirgaceae bacterium BMA10]|uniref:Lipoprotein n=1 Tax=Splendidivirga corallicola TaxID=3051826 RepID=A0ABT8L0R1_9BACT|nr:hypothetical protein [Fulvivirgaceae bacterium BMA10]